MGTFPRMAQIHSPELFDRVLHEAAMHGTIAAAARAVGVNHLTVSHWARRYPEFGDKLKEALADGIEAMADDVLRIVDGDDLDDEVELTDAQGRRGIGTRRLKLAAAGGDPVARARLRAETRLKLIAARAPERYGNKVLPGYSAGGLVGNLSLPSLASASGSAPGADSKTPLVLDFGKLGRINAEASRDSADEILRVFDRARMQFGRRP